jgi:5'-methylthioadenosine phosphorylase
VARLAVVGGHSILGTDYESGDSTAHVVLQRHGAPDRRTPAHLVDHVANMRALVEQGCDRVLAISSVGGLRDALGVGSFIAPDDFIALHTSMSIYDDFRGHTVPALDPEWRRTVVDAWSGHAADIVRLQDGGVYWQTFGPRFETPAEVRFIAHFADVVGMTMASECIVAGELGLSYASICVVDNLANGVGERPLTPAEYEAGKRSNQAALVAALDAVIPALA